MKKVININFQGRVIPIEETAYDTLKNYVESLRRFFANEEGRDEIINDIEGRIAELFGESLKKGNTCITDSTVNEIIASMGKPEDFDDEEANIKSQLSGNEANNNYQNTNNQQFADAPRGRLYRDENDKILGGVCSGIAAYLRVDPTFVRLIFALLLFGAGTGFLLYMIMWIILPKKNLDHTLTSTKKLYRNPDEKILGGVASGLAAYFNIAVWIPRLIFALPLISSIFSSTLRHAFWWSGPSFPNFVFGSFTGTLTLVYIVLWAVIPEAKSASEKLEMKGEKVDLNSIKNTIQEDLEGFKTRAEKAGKDFSEKAKVWSKDFSSTAKTTSQNFSEEFKTATVSNSSRLASVLGIIFKAFFLLIAGTIAFAMLMALIGILISGASVMPLKGFFVGGFFENILLLITVVCFLIVPIIALVTGIVRRAMGFRKNNSYYGITFGGLWLIGLVSAIVLSVTIAQNYKTYNKIEETVNIEQPNNSKLLVKVAEQGSEIYENGLWGFNWDDDEDIPFGINDDTMHLRSVTVGVAKSDDSLFHVKIVKLSRGNKSATAKETASQITYNVQLQNNVLTLPDGFYITKKDKYRVQQVLVVIEVPEGKKIEKDQSLNRFHKLGINYSRRKGTNYNLDDTWDNNYQWGNNKEFLMTSKGLSMIKSDFEDNQEEEFNSEEELRKLEERRKRNEQRNNSDSSTRYKYQPAKNEQKQEPIKSTALQQSYAESFLLRFSI